MGARAATAAATLERIRDAATALFSELSYDEVSLEAVARSAGVSLPTILRKFGTKDALFWRYLVPMVGDAGGPRSSLVFALAVAAVWTALAGTLYRRDVRIRV